MRSLIVSDLHLGAPSGNDVLRHPTPRHALLRAIEGVDQLVLLGDVVELRGVPAAEALERAAPALGEIGAAAAGARIVVVPGNHDHRLAAEWIDRRRQRRAATPLRIVETWRPGRSGLGSKLARALAAEELLMAYPGLWVRPGVWATHGHYLDCHNEVPALEPLAAAGIGRLAGGLTPGRLSPDAYEAVLAPLYAFSHELAQRATGRHAVGAGTSMRVWQRLQARDGHGLDRLLLRRALIPGAVAVANLAGLGPFSSDLSPGALDRAALTGMATVVRRLGIDAEHVVFGHTHRTGPLPGDGSDWRVEGATRLWNCGSWVHEPPLIGSRGRNSPHWPGACVVVEDDAPPRVERLLADAAPFG